MKESSRKVINGLRRSLFSFDLFGQQVGFNIKGEKSYGTMMGSLISLLILSLTFVYAWARLLDLEGYNDTRFQ